MFVMVITNLITDNGAIELNVPKDRKGDFEPLIIPKKQNRAAGIDKKILSLYAKGMSLYDIREQIYELYKADVSESLISKITDGVMDEVRSWQNRPLESVYPIVYFDCLVVKVSQDKHIISTSQYMWLYALIYLEKKTF